MRIKLIEARNKKEAKDKARWAAKIEEVVTGHYMAFESIEVWREWKNIKPKWITF